MFTPRCPGSRESLGMIIYLSKLPSVIHLSQPVPIAKLETWKEFEILYLKNHNDFYSFNTEDWTEGLVNASQTLYQSLIILSYLPHIHTFCATRNWTQDTYTNIHPRSSFHFEVGSYPLLSFPEWFQTLNPLTSASWITEIIGMQHHTLYKSFNP